MKRERQLGCLVLVAVVVGFWLGVYGALVGSRAWGYSGLAVVLVSCAVAGVWAVYDERRSQ